MEAVMEKWDQEDFNRWVAKHDEALTYNEVQEEAKVHGLDAEVALLYARIFPGGEE